MTRADLRLAVLDALGTIAPEANPKGLRPDVNLRDQLDLDSVDFLNFVLALHERLHVEIPEADYPKFLTLDGGVAYLAARLAVPE
jgi:acyl carrier protein